MNVLVINNISFFEVELPAEGKVKGGKYPPPPPDSFSTISSSVSSFSIGSSSSGKFSGGEIASTTSFIIMSGSGNIPEPSVLMFDDSGFQ